MSYITDEKTLSVDISDKIHTLLRAQTLTLSGDLFNLDLQESLAIPVAHLGKVEKYLSKYLAMAIIQAHQ